MKGMLLAGSIAGLLGVALGAFGAHAIKGQVPPERLATWETAVLYHLVHAVIISAIALAGPRLSGLMTAAGLAFGVGILVFSGSLYLLVLTNMRWLGAVTPLGGVAFLVGWLLLAAGAWRGGP